MTKLPRIARGVFATDGDGKYKLVQHDGVWNGEEQLLAATGRITLGDPAPRI